MFGRLIMATLPEITEELKERYRYKSITRNICTFGGRFIHFAESVDLADKLPHSPLDVLVVGAGGTHTARPDYCREWHELFELFLFFQIHGISCDQLDIADLSFQSFDEVIKNDAAGIGLEFSKTVGKVNHGNEYKAYIDSADWRYGNVQLPAQLTDKLKEGQHRRHEGDIATAPLPLGGKPYGFVVCRHVLYDLPEEGQKLALINLSKSMKESAILAVGVGFAYTDEKGREYDRLPEIGRWFNERWQKALGFEYVQRLRSFKRCLLRKVNVEVG